MSYCLLGGLTSKLATPEFIETLNNYDIVCLTETKTDKADIIDIPNFQVFYKHRSELSFRKSGGIVVYIRNTLAKFCSIISNNCDHVLWVKIEGKTFGINDHFLIGTVYIPPSNSRFSSIEIFEDLENEIYYLSTEHKCICLDGDFNSRVSSLKDFTDCDENFEQTYKHKS